MIKKGDKIVCNINVKIFFTKGKSYIAGSDENNGYLDVLADDGTLFFVPARNFDPAKAPSQSYTVSPINNLVPGDLVVSNLDALGYFTNGNVYEFLEYTQNNSWIKIKKDDSGLINSIPKKFFDVYLGPKYSVGDIIHNGAYKYLVRVLNFTNKIYVIIALDGPNTGTRYSMDLITVDNYYKLISKANNQSSTSPGILNLSIPPVFANHFGLDSIDSSNPLKNKAKSNDKGLVEKFPCKCDGDTLLHKGCTCGAIIPGKWGLV